MNQSFGRLPPTDFEHFDKWPLRVSLVTRPTPVVLGINWYRSMNSPQLDEKGRWWFDGLWGGIDGGHAICVKPGVLTDPLSWWEFYNQNPYPECVGFSESRAMSLLNRTRYDARWLYREAQLIDEWPGTDYDGTSVRAGFEVLRTRGHRRLINGVTGPERPGDGIAAYRWAMSVADVHGAIQMPLADSLGGVPLLQSWGTGFPHIVWLRDEDLDRLLNEDGEAGVVVDR